jgi:RNA polymerase sigma-70 factor (sigma-E family)
VGTDEPLSTEPRESFDDYVVSRGPALVRFGFLLTHDHHLAQDLAQEGLARLHRHWSRVRSKDDPDAFVRKTMVNLLISWRRRRAWTEHPTSEPPDTPSDVNDDVAERDEMWRFLGALPAKQRAVLVLRYYENLTDPEIASIVGCSPATVRSHASKAIHRLRAVSAAELIPGGRHD